MTNKKIIVTPCIVKIWLYWSALSNVLSGLASWLRINRASTPPIRKNANALKPYSIPIFLWSTVVNQLHQPVIAVGRRITPVRAGTLVAVAISLVLARRRQRLLLLVGDPSLPLGLVQRTDPELHLAVLEPAELGALSGVEPRMIRGEHDVVRLAGDDVLLPEQLWRPERVDHLVV